MIQRIVPEILIAAANTIMIPKNEMEAYLALRAAIIHHDEIGKNYIHSRSSTLADCDIAYHEIQVAHQKLFKTIRANSEKK